MTNEQFWKLADKYEYYNGDIAIVYMKNVRALSKDILDLNKGNVEESRKDFDLFEFANWNRATNIFETVAKKYNKGN